MEKSWHTEDKFHIIVSNPPYIGHEEKASLSDEVVKYEPQMALFADERGLSFYRCIAEFAKMSIHDQGALFFEIGSTQRQDVEAILSKFQWSDISSVKDYEKHDRVMKGLFYVSKSSTSKSSCDRLENV